MFLEKCWTATRSFVPIQLYPLLAPLHRRRRRRHLRRLHEDDRRCLAGNPDLRVPPPELRYNVAGPCTIPQFLAGGEQTVRDIDDALSSVSLSLTQFRRFLDFGCGCGRLLLALRHARDDVHITGCDVDERAIGWCQANLPQTTCVLTDPLPPLPFADAAFDVIWCGSVFTHLDEDRQDRWLAELQRILTPSGVLLASVHGPHSWEPRLPPWTIARLRDEGIVFAHTGADAGIHPSWYQVTWHTERYIRRHWGAMFDISGYVQRGFKHHQDVVVARKRGGRVA